MITIQIESNLPAVFYSVGKYPDVLRTAALRAVRVGMRKGRTEIIRNLSREARIPNRVLQKRFTRRPKLHEERDGWTASISFGSRHILNVGRLNNPRFRPGRGKKKTGKGIYAVGGYHYPEGFFLRASPKYKDKYKKGEVGVTRDANGQLLSVGIDDRDLIGAVSKAFRDAQGTMVNSMSDEYERQVAHLMTQLLTRTSLSQKSSFIRGLERGRRGLFRGQG